MWQFLDLKPMMSIQSMIGNYLVLERTEILRWLHDSVYSHAKCGKWKIFVTPGVHLFFFFVLIVYKCICPTFNFYFWYYQTYWYLQAYADGSNKTISNTISIITELKYVILWPELQRLRQIGNMTWSKHRCSSIQSTICRVILIEEIWHLNESQLQATKLTLTPAL